MTGTSRYASDERRLPPARSALVVIDPVNHFLSGVGAAWEMINDRRHPLTTTGGTMFAIIDREELRRLIEEEQAQVVEVLPEPEYDWAHIAGAVNIPLKELDETTTAGLDRDRPVVTYCNDFQ